MDTKLETKSAFAARLGVSKARVSQWIKEGKIGTDELEGQGRGAKIKVDQAIEKLKLRIDPGQRVGNGIATRLSPAISEAPATEGNHLDLRLKQARLQAAEAQNRKLEEDEKLRKGIYVRKEEAQEEAVHLTTIIVQTTEQMFIDWATETAAAYQLPQRDIVHLARKRFREARAKIAASLASQAAEWPQFVEEETEAPAVEYDRNKN